MSFGQETEQEIAVNTDNTELIDKMVEADQDVVGAQQIDDAVDCGVSGLDALNEVNDIVHERYESDKPLTGTEILRVEETVESIMSGLGVASTKLTMESFKGKDRHSELVSTMENRVTEVAGNIGKAIIAGLNKVVGFIAKLFQSKAVLKRYIEGLKKQVSEGAEFEGNGTVKGAAYNGTNDIKLAMDSCVDAVKLCNTAVDNLNTALQAASSGTDEDLSKAAMAMASAVRPSTYESILPRNHDGKYGYFANGVSFEFGEEEQKAGSNNVLSVLTIRKVVNDDRSEESAALGKSECLTALDQAMHALDAFNGMSRFENKLLASVKLFTNIIGVKYGNAMVNRASKKDDHAGVEKHSRANLGRLVTMVTRAIGIRIGSLFPSEIFKSIKAVGDYVAKSRKL